jgi:TonB family protein
MRSIYIHPVFRALVPVCLCAMPAAAQGEQRIGNVDVYLQADSSTGRDLSHALLKPDAFHRAGSLVWACGGRPSGLAVGLHLAGDSSTAAPRIVSRFDAGVPDTLVLDTGDSAAVALVPAGDAGAFIGRARSAQRLAVQVLPDLPRRPAAEYAYTLAGLDSALNRMGCTADAAPGARNAGVQTMRSLVEWADTLTPAPPLGVVVGPSGRTVSAFRRRMERNYPPLMRDAGISGEVVLRFRIMEDGTVDSTDVHVVSATHPEFVAPALRSLPALTFHPARVNGRPVKLWTTLPIWFMVAPEPTNMEELTRYARQNYPSELRREQVRGPVVLRFRVLPTGLVDPATIEVVSSAHPLLNDVAIKGAQLLRYPPRTVEGPAGSDVATVSVPFTPDGPPLPRTGSGGIY